MSRKRVAILFFGCAPALSAACGGIVLDTGLPPGAEVNDASPHAPDASSPPAPDASSPPEPDASGGATDAGAPEAAPFTITPAASQVNVLRGNSATLAITLDRGGASGMVTVAASGLPDGVTSAHVPIAGGVTTGTLSFNAAAGATLGPAQLSLSLEDGGAASPVTLLVQDPPGSVDTTFGVNGTAWVVFSGSCSINQVSLAGKDIWLGGDAIVGGGYGLALARLDDQGTLDPTFGTGGDFVANDPGDRIDVPAQFVVSPTGGVLVAGFMFGWAGTYDSVLVAAFTKAGKPDPSFGGTGYFVDDFGADSKASAAVLQGDGSLVIAGFESTAGVMLRLSPDGGVDPSFGSGGEVPSPGQGFFGLGLLSSGDIMAGSGTSETKQSVVRRYSRDGAIDAVYGNNGRAIGPNVGAIERMIVQSDDKVVVMTEGPPLVDGGASHVITLTRLRTDGTLDPTFGYLGTATTSLSGSPLYGDLAVGPDGRLAVALDITSASSPTSFTVARYTPEGVLDTTFAGTGLVDNSAIVGGTAKAVAIDSFGRILVAGMAPDPGSAGFNTAVVVRYWP
jgi:uncharacterized delta-60 repeat protein